MSPQYLDGGPSATQRVGNKPWLHKIALKRKKIKGKEDWECSSAIQDLSNMHEGFNSACILSPSPSALPLFLSLCPLPHTQSQVWTDRCTQLECSGRASRRACRLGKVDEIKDKWPSDKKVESGQNVSQRGIPNSSPIVHP